MQDRQQCFPYYLHSEYTLAILLKQMFTVLLKHNITLHLTLHLHTLVK